MDKSDVCSTILLPAVIFLSGCTHFSVLNDKPEKSLAEQSSLTDMADNELFNNDDIPAWQNNRECTPTTQSSFYDLEGEKSDTIKVRATGYGAPPKSFYPEPQRRLMAMRAAKIDAYRSLAERINGVHIWGGTTIGDMVVEKDRFRVYLDTHISGARILSENPSEDGTFETVVEVKIGQYFLKKALSRKTKRARHDNNPCRENAPMLRHEFQRISLSGDSSTGNTLSGPHVSPSIPSSLTPSNSTQFYFKKE